jgi:hypothetical protein
MTASEIARTLDRPTGSIFGVITRMLKDGLLLVDTDEPTRGTRYSLAPAAFAMPSEPQRGPPKPSVIQPGQQLLLVDQPPDRARAQKVLGENRLMERVVWGAQIAGGWLLAIDDGDTELVENLQMALEAAGSRCRLLPVTEVSTGLELRTRAVKLLDEREKTMHLLESEHDER